MSNAIAISDMEMSYFVAIPLTPPKAPGYTWTLASRLGHMLRLAEERFGPRDRTYTPLGVEFAGERPQIWYPGNCKNVVIQLSLSSLNNPYRAVRQMAHECVHLLSPVGERRANVLEEGLAEYFSALYAMLNFAQAHQDANYIAPYSYSEALRLTQELLSFDPYVVKQIRLTEPTICNITADTILMHCPSAPKELAQALTCEFLYQ